MKLVVDSFETVVVVTELFRTLYDIITKDDYANKAKRGVMITGPPGTGKSMSCVYLLETLRREKVPFLVCFVESLKPSFLWFEP